MARNEDRIRALRAGFHLHIVKPVDFTELVAVVQNLAALQTGLASSKNCRASASSHIQ
jgi:DNA-binding response OmpR family regulator